MVNIRNTNEIVSSLIDFYRLVKPNLDTKAGSFTRDIVISPMASQLSLLYDEIANVLSKQSLRLVIGSDLDKLAKNFGLLRKQGTASSGVALLTFKSVDGNFVVNKGDQVFASNGISFLANTSTRIESKNINFYRSNAIKYKADLDLLGITDLYAVEISVTASTVGSFGNISKYSLNRTNILGVSNVTNVNSFSSGSDAETDAIFRNRILSTFSGSSVGTNLGYLNAASSVSNVLDVYIVEPNDPLMTRDGTIVEKDVDGNFTIVKEGSGGKVDVIVLGSNLIEATDTFIYLDKSNKNDPTDSSNDYVIGQILSDSNKTVNKKRFDNIKSGFLPNQPVRSVIEVSGSLSGNNFKEKSIDENGIVSGNYEIVKDTGYYANTPWGFDTFSWISDKISDFQEERIKNQSSGQDNLTFTDVKQISKIEQQILITNENSRVTSDRSIIQLLHYPCTSVTRVFNTNTGERYIVTNQNVDGSSSINTTGRIKISGNTLPTSTDLLQVDYNWIVDYDPNIDYDGLINTKNNRTVDDSVDWGYSSLISNEVVNFTLDDTGTFYSGSTTLPVNTVISAKKYKEVFGSVYKITSGKYVDRLALKIQNIDYEIISVDFIKLYRTNLEIFKSNLNDGFFEVVSSLNGETIVYELNITLPSDTIANENDYVSVLLNSTDTYSVNNIVSSSSNFTLSIPVDNVSESSNTLKMLVSYISNSFNVYNGAISSLPASKMANGFIESNSVGSINNLNNNLRHENAIVQLNTDSELYIEISLTTQNILIDSVVCIINTVSGLEYWNKYNVGTITSNSTNQKYQFILSGLNSPSEGDRVIIFFYPKELSRFQPINYSNELFYSSLREIKYDGDNYYIPILELNDGYNLNFSIVNSYDGYEYLSFSDGYILSTADPTATFASGSVDFSTIPNIENLKINIQDGYYPGIYDILSYNENSNNLTIGLNLSNVDGYNTFVTRLLDNKDLTIQSVDYENNKIILSGSYTILNKVYFGLYEYDYLKSSPSRVSINLIDNVLNQGIISIYGSSILKLKDYVFTYTSNSLKINVADAVRKYFGYSSISQIPSNVKLVNFVSLEKVTETNNIVSSIDHQFDLTNSKLKNNLYFDFVNGNISDLEIELQENITNSNILSLGDKIRGTFYICIENDSESINFSKTGIQYTNKKFINVDKIIYSGFKSSTSSRILVKLFNQPNTLSRYKVTYDYSAPKQNERITIRYNYNKLISDVTFAIENSRPINADVLVKEAEQIDVVVSVSILINTSLGLDTTTIKQNVSDAITNTINLLELGRTLEDIDIQLASDGIDGVDRTRVLSFNVYEKSGSVTKIIAQNNQYFNLKQLTINTEFR